MTGNTTPTAGLNSGFS